MNNLSRISNWIAKHKILAMLVGIALFAVPLLVVHILYKCDLGVNCFVSDWESGDVLAYIAGFEAFAGTAFLGILTLLQNDRFKEENDNSQERLQSISEEQAKALKQILLMDQSSNIPLVDITESPKGEEFLNIRLLLDEGAGYLRVPFVNITDYPISNIHVNGLDFYTYDIKYNIEKTNNYYNPQKGLPARYSSYVAFNLSSSDCKDKNEYFERIFRINSSNNAKQMSPKEYLQNERFILELTFEIKNVYGKRIIETISCEFRANFGGFKNEGIFELGNKELRFEVVEESKND